MTSQNTQGLSKEREEGIRARLDFATPGPWERGQVWLQAGLIYSDSGDRVASDQATRCAFCHLGKPTWSGRASINGTVMPAHRHRNPEPYDVEHSVSSADGGLVAYEGGGIVRGEDTEFFVAARDDIAVLLQGIDQLRAEVAAARKFAGEMRDFCSPHGVATDYADRLLEAMDRAKAADPGQPGMTRGPVPSEYVRLKAQLEANLQKMTACAAQPPKPGAEEGRATQGGIAAGIRTSLAWAIHHFEGSAAREAFQKRLEGGQ